MKCPFNREDCEYSSDCSIINDKHDDTLFCIRLIEYCLEKDYWLERAFNSFEQIHQNYCKVKLSLQVLNPAPIIGKISESKPMFYSKILVPVSILKKPLVHGLDVRCNGTELSHLPDRIVSSRALASIIYKQMLLPFDSYFVQEKPQDVKDFIAALVGSSGRLSDKAYEKGRISEEMKDEILDFIEDRISNKMSATLSSELSNAMNVAATIKSYLLNNDDETRKAIEKVSIVYSAFPIDIQNKITHDLIARAAFIHEGIVNNIYGSFTFPFVALKDFLYVRRTFNWSNVLTFIRMAKTFQNNTRERLEISMQYLNEMLLDISDGSLVITAIDELAKHLLNTTAFLQIVNNNFCLLVPIDITRLRNTVDLSFLKECRIENNAGIYGLNIKLARSTHFQIQSSSVAYNIVLKKNSDSYFSRFENNPECFFGRVEQSKSIIHLNTRKESVTKPRGKPDNGISSKFAINEATYPVKVKYKLGFQANFFLLALFFVSSLITVISCLGLYKINSVSVGDLVSLFSLWFVSIMGIVFANVLVRKWSIVDALTRTKFFFLFGIGGTGLVLLIIALIKKLLL